MKKLINIILIIALILPYFTFLEVVVASSDEYVVESIKEDGSIANIGTYSNYSDAKTAMNNYKSTITDTAVIRRNGKIVNATYGIFRPNASLSTLTISTDYGSRYFSPAYNSDTLLLDYNPDNNKVQIMISGVKGWVNVDNVTIYPISYITDTNNSYDQNKKYVKINSQSVLRVREGPGTNYQHIGCSNALSCLNGDAASLWADGGNVYEWLNYEKIVNDGTYNWYQINVDGIVGYVASPISSPYLSEYSITNIKQDYKTYYYVNGEGELYHQYYVAVSDGTWSTRLGKAPLYLKQNVNYYSFDGNYFYDDFTKMVIDMRNNNYNNAVNKMPYYNYYQYMPARTQTVYNIDNLNAYIGFDSKVDRNEFYELKEIDGKYKWVAKESWKNSSETSFPKGQSMLYNEGEAFIKSQEKYGVNAAQTLSLAITESGWGRSYMSVREYNIFGHGAFDSAPDEYAASYKTISDGITAHAFKYIAKNYANPISGTNYNGSHYGNKLSGNNVSYASDAYWGEKMAGNYYTLDKSFSFQDYNQRKILGIKQISEAAAVYSMPSTDSIKYYDLKAIPNIPVTILEEVEGMDINGNKIWYKIQSDLPIDESRQLVDLNAETYNFETSYAYIHSSYIYKDDGKPIISANNVTINAGAKYEQLKGVSAYDSFDGDLTSKIIVSKNEVNVNKAGVYNVVYKVTDSENNTTEKTINVTVLESKPTITASDITLNAGASFNPLTNVTASDYEDGDLTSKITITSNNVDVNTPGEYSVTYGVTDSGGNNVTKTVKVTILEPIYKEVENLYYFDYLKEVNNNLNIKGFIALKGVNNTLNNNIKYKIVFKNDLTGKEFYQYLTRITNKDNMPFMIEGENGYDYTYSWFEGNIDIDKLDNGDYTLYLVANDNEHITEVPLSNVFNRTMLATHTTTKKQVLFRNNYESRDAAIQMFVRDKLIGTKTSNSKYNINNEYSTINFKDNKLVIKGASHIIGGNYSKDTEVKRSLTLENIETFETYTYDIGSITTGDYVIELRVPDGFDKTRGWFETNIDLSNLKNGTYAIYISTSSNISDFGELQDIFSRKIESNLTYNGKNYSFSVNRNKRYRIELVVKDA